MAECSISRCSQERRAFRKELQRWGRNVLLLVGYERIAEEVTGRRKWKRLMEPVNKLESSVSEDWRPDETCAFCKARKLNDPAGGSGEKSSSDKCDGDEKGRLSKHISWNSTQIGRTKIWNNRGVKENVRPFSFVGHSKNDTCFKRSSVFKTSKEDELPDLFAATSKKLTSPTKKVFSPIINSVTRDRCQNGVVVGSRKPYVLPRRRNEDEMPSKHFESSYVDMFSDSSTDSVISLHSSPEKSVNRYKRAKFGDLSHDVIVISDSSSELPAISTPPQKILNFAVAAKCFNDLSNAL